VAVTRARATATAVTQSVIAAASVLCFQSVVQLVTATPQHEIPTVMCALTITAAAGKTLLFKVLHSLLYLAAAASGYTVRH
jgi:hypothetical protein